MNQYDYQRWLANIEALPQSIKAVPTYREPMRAFAGAEAERQLQEQRMANLAASRTMALEQGKQRLELGRGRLALEQKQFEQDFERATRLRKISEKEYRRGLPLQIAGLGIEAFRGWEKFKAMKKLDIQRKDAIEKMNAMIAGQEEFNKQLLQIFSAGQTERAGLAQPSTMYDLPYSIPSTAPPRQALPQLSAPYSIPPTSYPR